MTHKDTVVLINATPHALAYAVSAVNDTAAIMSWAGHHTQDNRGGVECMILEPCGARFAADAMVSGPPLDSHVVYELYPGDETYRLDVERVKSIANNYHGARCILVASTISAQALGPELDLGFMTIDVRFPILADAATRLPPEQRWADRLGVPA